MTAPASRERIAELRVLWGGPYMSKDQQALLAAAEAYHDEHDRAERLADGLTEATEELGMVAAERDAARAAIDAVLAMCDRQERRIGRASAIYIADIRAAITDALGDAT